MKNRNCPNKDACWDYDASNCTGCALGEKFSRITRRIKRLKSENAELRATLSKMETVEKELRARLDKAVEPQFSNGDEVYAVMDMWLYTGVFPVTIKSADVVYEVFDGEEITTQHRTRIFADRSEAEAMLEELKGEQQ